MVRAQDVIDKATAQKKVHEGEVAEGERRLAQLQAEASKPAELPPQVSTLQGQIDALIRERDAGRSVLEFREERQVDGVRTALHRSNPADAHRSSGIGSVVEQPELRFAECNRVRERRARRSDWSSDWARGHTARVSGS